MLNRFFFYCRLVIRTLFILARISLDEKCSTSDSQLHEQLTNVQSRQRINLSQLGERIFNQNNLLQTVELVINVIITSFNGITSNNGSSYNQQFYQINAITVEQFSFAASLLCQFMKCRRICTLIEGYVILV